MKKDFWNFNKEVLLGELGAVIFAPLTAHIFSSFTKSISLISISAVIGAILGAAIFWLASRILDHKKTKNYSERGLFIDISYFTPGAFFLTVFLYYPMLFLISEYLITNNYLIISSVFISQIIAFFIFLISVNFYRHILIRLFNKTL